MFLPCKILSSCYYSSNFHSSAGSICELVLIAANGYLHLTYTGIEDVLLIKVNNLSCANLVTEFFNYDAIIFREATF